MTKGNVVLQLLFDLEHGGSRRKMEMTQAVFREVAEAAWENTHMNLAYSAQQKNLVVCCWIPSAKFVRDGKKKTLSWVRKSLPSDSALPLPSSMTHSTPGPLLPSLFTPLGR